MATEGAFTESEGFASLLAGGLEGMVSLRVLSGSMSPAIETGDLVSIAPCSWKECRTGDIIVFKRGYTLVSHRLLLKIRFGGRAFLFQAGDAMSRGELIEPESIVGRCTEVRKKNASVSLENARVNAKWARRGRQRIMTRLVKDIVKCALKKTVTSR